MTSEAPVTIEADTALHLSERAPVDRPPPKQILDAAGNLGVLKEAGVVQGHRNGREVVYRLADEHLSHIVIDAVAHAAEG